MTSLHAVHQVVPSLDAGDAVGAHTLRLRDLLRGTGLASEIFTAALDPALVGEARPLAELPAPDPAGMAIVYQCSIGNEVVDLLLRRPDPLVVNYHNLTPVEHLLRWAPDMAHLVSWGRHQLRSLAPRAVLGIGDSAYNTVELERAGFRATATVPVLLDLPLAPPADDTRRSSGTGERWLFVGRIVPNKAQHDLVLALAWARAVVDPAATLRLVGRNAAPGYHHQLEALVDELDLGAAVTFTGPVTDAQLAEEYRRADAFVCLSDHEGFGIPLLEAMAHGLPVVAYASSAVPETVGAAGLVLPHKRPALVAAAAHRATTDTALRRHLVHVGLERAATFDRAHTGPRMLAALGGALALPGAALDTTPDSIERS